MLAGTVAAVAALTATVVTAVSAVTGPSSARTLPAVRLLAKAAPVRYVALGDSYAAGTGTGTGAGDGGSARSGCARSADAYPAQWARHHATASFAAVTCDGATTSGVISGQLAALSARTSLVSITIGGNDAGFSHVMKTCVLEFWDNS